MRTPLLSPMNRESTQLRTLALGCLAALAAVFLFRIAGPPDLMNNDQQKFAAYVLDAAVNGNWIVQIDATGDITSKPPLPTWLAALSIVATGSISEWALYLPGAIATALSVLLTGWFARRHFGDRAALWALLFATANAATMKLVALARTDTLFVALTWALAIVAVEAATARRIWLCFWPLAAAVTLTKGPLGVLLAAGGLLACVPVLWRGSADRPPMRGGPLWVHAIGAAVFLALAGGWFWLAYRELGTPLVDKMIGRELVGHAVSSDEDPSIGDLFKPLGYLLGRGLPWSLLGAWGLWEALRRRGAPPFVARALACYALFGLLVFTLGSHKRGDHIMPLLPALWVLGGWAVAARWNPARPLRFAMPALAAFVAFAAAQVWFGLPKLRDVQRNVILRDFAPEVKRRLPPGATLLHSDDPYAIQFYLGTMRPKGEPAAVAKSDGAGPRYALARGDREETVAAFSEEGWRVMAESAAEPGGAAPFVVLLRRD